MVSLLESSALELSTCAKVSEGGSPEGLILDFDLDSGADAESEYASDCRNVTNTWTKPDGLYLGRQRGSQDADAAEFTIDGECAVFINM